MKKFICLLFILVIAVCSLKVSIAAEHPGEHPGTTAAPKEHPGQEHPGKTGELSAGQIIQGIKEHINLVTKKNAGIFPLNDAVEAKDLRLKLIRIHEDRVSYIKKEGAYFACTDFITEDGRSTYDVDFWMKEDDKGKLKVYQAKIHKKNGIPRFTYKDDEIVLVEPGQMAPEEHSGQRHMAVEQGT